jgi:hypothetical protein
MRILSSLIFLFIFLLGVLLGIKAYRLSMVIYWGTERRIRAAIFDSALYGLSLSLAFFGGVYFFASTTDNTYTLDISLLVKSFVIFLIPGFLVLLGSLLQYFIFGLYRDRLMEFLLGRKSDKTQSDAQKK